MLILVSTFKPYFEDTDGDIVNALSSGAQAGSSGDSGNAFQSKFIITCKETELCKESQALVHVKPADDGFPHRIRLCPNFFDFKNNEEKPQQQGTHQRAKQRDNS